MQRPLVFENFAIQCWNGEIVRIVFFLDCSDREVMICIATTAGFPGKMARDLMAKMNEPWFGIMGGLPLQIEWFPDNVSAYTSHRTKNLASRKGMGVCITTV